MNIQLDLFSRPRRPQMRDYADRGRDAQGEFTLFRCRKCRGETEVHIALRLSETARGVPCNPCNSERNR